MRSFALELKHCREQSTSLGALESENFFAKNSREERRSGERPWFEYITSSNRSMPFPSDCAEAGHSLRRVRRLFKCCNQAGKRLFERISPA